MFVKDVARLVVGAGDRYQMRPALREQRSAAHGASTRPAIVRKPSVCRAFGLNLVAMKAGGSGLVTVSFRSSSSPPGGASRIGRTENRKKAGLEFRKTRSSAVPGPPLPDMWIPLDPAGSGAGCSGVDTEWWIGSSTLLSG